MLTKLLKYELKSILKFLVIFYFLTIFFAILTRIFFANDTTFMMMLLAKILSGITISMMVSSLINNVMRLWVRFRNNFYKDESYLTHTLPVSKTTLYLSKILSAIISLALTFLVIIAGILIAYYTKDNIGILKDLLTPILEIYDVNIIKVALSFIFILFLELINILSAGYSGLIIGHKFNNCKMALSVIFSFIIYIIFQLLTFASLYLVALFNKDLMLLFTTSNYITLNTFNIIINSSLIIYTVTFIINTFINARIFNKGVNVE